MSNLEHQSKVKIYAHRIEEVLLKEIQENKTLDLVELYNKNAGFADDLQKFFDSVNKEKEVVERISNTSKIIEARLDVALNSEGKIDPTGLSVKDPELFDVLNEFVLAKTKRDDPQYVASDIAKLLEAKNPKTPLGEALSKLGEAIKD